MILIIIHDTPFETSSPILSLTSFLKGMQSKLENEAKKTYQGDLTKMYFFGIFFIHCISCIFPSKGASPGSPVVHCYLSAGTVEFQILPLPSQYYLVWRAWHANISSLASVLGSGREKKKLRLKRKPSVNESGRKTLR